MDVLAVPEEAQEVRRGGGGQGAAFAFPEGGTQVVTLG
jgi:hypothetical protein